MSQKFCSLRSETLTDTYLLIRFSIIYIEALNWIISLKGVSMCELVHYQQWIKEIKLNRWKPTKFPYFSASACGVAILNIPPEFIPWHDPINMDFQWSQLGYCTCLYFYSPTGLLGFGPPTRIMMISPMHWTDQVSGNLTYVLFFFLLNIPGCNSVYGMIVIGINSGNNSELR